MNIFKIIYTQITVWFNIYFLGSIVMAIWGAKNGYCFGKDKYLARMYNINEITKQDYVALKTEPIEIIREKLKYVETFEQIRGELEMLSYAFVGSVGMSTFYPLVFTYIVYDYARTQKKSIRDFFEELF